MSDQPVQDTSNETDTTTDSGQQEPQERSFTNQPSVADKEKAYQEDRERLAKEHGIEG